MNYYQFHIGDYASHTRYLTPMQDLAYRRLLDAYYMRELPILGEPDAVARSIGMADYADDVDIVLGEFFSDEVDEHGCHWWNNTRCEEEIAAYQKRRADAAAAGRASAEVRFNDRSTTGQRPSIGGLKPVQGPSTNHEPVTKNQEPHPSLNGKDEPRRSAPRPLVGFAEFWEAFGKKVARPAAEKAWRKLDPDAALAALIATKAAAYAGTVTDRAFHAHPATWLNQRRWEDEPASAPAVSAFQPLRNMPHPNAPAAVVHEPTDPSCACERCYIARRGHNETVSIPTKEASK